MDPQRDDALRPPFGQRAYSCWRVLPQRIEQACSLKIPRLRFVGKAVFQIPVIVLVRLGVDDNGMGQTSAFDQLQMIFQRISGRFVGRVRCIGEARGIEQVNVRLDRRGPGAASAPTPAAAVKASTASRRVNVFAILWLYQTPCSTSRHPSTSLYLQTYLQS